MKILWVIFLCWINTSYAITLNFEQAPTSDALQTLARMGHKNLVIAPQIKGTITLALSQVSWQQALNAILNSQHLAESEQHNILYITPHNERALQEVNIHLHYLQAEPTAKLIQNQKMLSTAGTIAFDQRSNLLLIKDTEQHIQSINAFIQAIDTPIQQISIKARIVAIDERALKEWGIKLQSIGTHSISNKLSMKNLALNNGLAHSAGQVGLSIGSLPNGFLLDLELQALEAEDEGKIISAPSLTVSNQQEASIEQGSEVPYATVNNNGSTQVQFKKAVLGLQVTPEITANQGMNLKLHLSKDHVTQYSGAAGSTPIIATAQINTQVWVKSGKTIILGGIFIQENENDIQQVPWLGDIPLIGAFFRHQSKLKHKAELLIFVTPTIIKSPAINRNDNP